MVEFREFDTNFNIEFDRVDKNTTAAAKNDDIYVIDPKTGNPVKYELKNTEVCDSTNSSSTN